MVFIRNGLKWWFPDIHSLSQLQKLCPAWQGSISLTGFLLGPFWNRGAPTPWSLWVLVPLDSSQGWASLTQSVVRSMSLLSTESPNTCRPPGSSPGTHPAWEQPGTEALGNSQDPASPGLLPTIIMGSFLNGLATSLQVKFNIFLNYVPASVWINFSNCFVVAYSSSLNAFISGAASDINILVLVWREPCL